MSLEEKFNVACDEVRKFSKRPGDIDMLEIYSLYKQATVGNCNTVKPIDSAGRRKWDAWNNKKGVDSNTAMEQYIAKIKSMAPIYA